MGGVLIIILDLRLADSVGLFGSFCLACLAEGAEGLGILNSGRPSPELWISSWRVSAQSSRLTSLAERTASFRDARG